MKSFLGCVWALAVLGGVVGLGWGQGVPAAGVKAGAGEVTKYTFSGSRIYPGTTRDYWVYVPAQYDGEKAASLFVDQDAVQFNAPAVFDQLIAAGDMPVTIGVFVQPGVVRASGAGALDRFNRSVEYDAMGDEYARFLLNELLPDVEKKVTAGGKAIKLSRNPDDRAIAGSSSGAVAAFTVAWERPDSFHRVFSAIGTYVGLRGANVYPTLIRKYEPKPLRVFLQDGSADQNIYGGDWWMANQEMERALTFAGYEVNHAWGTGGHNSQHATEIFPEAMKWLWKDWAKGVKAGEGSEMMKQILIPGEDWKQVGGAYNRLDGCVVNAAGVVTWCDTGARKNFTVDAKGELTSTASDAPKSGQAYGPDGKLYAVTGTELRCYEADGTFKVVASGIRANDLVIGANGNIYVTESASSGQITMEVWLVKPNGEKKVVDTGLKFPNGITFSPDQSLLYVSDYRSHWVYSYVIQPDGTLGNKQKYFDLYVRENEDDAAGDGMRVDADGRLYETTFAGIQVCDQAGRVNCILPVPTAGRVSAVTFGGPNLDTLYALCQDRVYARKLKVKGVLPFAAPIKPAAPKL